MYVSAYIVQYVYLGWKAKHGRIALRSASSVLPFLYGSRETVAALRMLIIYAGSPTIRCGAATRLNQIIWEKLATLSTPYKAHYCMNQQHIKSPQKYMCLHVQNV